MHTLTLRRTVTTLVYTYLARGIDIAPLLYEAIEHGEVTATCPLTGCHLTITYRHLFMKVVARHYACDFSDIAAFANLHSPVKVAA